MLKNYKKNLFTILIGCVFIFCLLWTEGFGLHKRYEYGNTIEKALNFWYERNLSSIGLSKILTTVDLNDNEKLVFYETNHNSLMVGLVKKKWNNKWIVIGKGGEVAFDYNVLLQNSNLKSPPKLNYMWCNLTELGINFGVIYDWDIEDITVGNKKAVLLSIDNKYIWYCTGKADPPDTDFDVKAYYKDNKLAYSYYP